MQKINDLEVRRQQLSHQRQARDGDKVAVRIIGRQIEVTINGVSRKIRIRKNEPFAATYERAEEAMQEALAAVAVDDCRIPIARTGYDAKKTIETLTGRKSNMTAKQVEKEAADHLRQQEESIARSAHGQLEKRLKAALARLK